jgi:UDP-2-acetamido-3-amino-2,3-dideoxy-glucuronate N-acetyltransferase
MTNKIHATAIVEDGVVLGDNCSVWHWTHICSGAKVGKNCSFGQNVYVAKSVVIGSNVRIQNNVSIYDAVTLEDDVFCGPSMVFTNVLTPRSAYPKKSNYLPTVVKQGASIGANATIVCGSLIGSYALVAAGSVVISDVKDFALVAGVPARQVGWVSRYGERLNLPLLGVGRATCPQLGEAYELSNGVVSLLKLP